MITRTNVSDQPVKVFGICGGAGANIYNGAGEFVWSWLLPHVIDCAPRSAPLMPGETLAYKVTWDGLPNFGGGAVLPGRYTLEVAVEGIVLRTSFKITPSKR